MSNTEGDLFREAYPDHFLSMGMTEQNIVSFAGGLAREGYFPFFHTFAIFIVGLKDTYANGASHPYLMCTHVLDVTTFVQEVEKND